MTLIMKRSCSIQYGGSRPHERGVQPVRRTGARKGLGGPWIPKFKIKIVKYNENYILTLTDEVTIMKVWQNAEHLKTFLRTLVKLNLLYV